jgi:predicted molibdopterin-dependent oxidoreductase YjgC
LFSAIEYKPPAEVADDEFPFQLTTGRIHVHYHTGTMTRNSPSLEREINECFLEMNPEDAAELGIADGEIVRVTSRRGSVSTRAKLAGREERKTVFMPFHFVESRANILTNPIFDPVAKIPEFKVCAVRVEKMGTEAKPSPASAS